MSFDEDISALDRIRARLTGDIAGKLVGDERTTIEQAGLKQRDIDCTMQAGPAPAMLGFEDSIWQAVERTAHIRYELDSLANRIYGTVPESGANGADKPREPDCMLDRLHLGLTRLHDNLTGIDIAQSRLVQLT